MRSIWAPTSMRRWCARGEPIPPRPTSCSQAIGARARRHPQIAPTHLSPYSVSGSAIRAWNLFLAPPFPPSHHSRPRRLARSYLVRLFHSLPFSGFRRRTLTPFRLQSPPDFRHQSLSVSFGILFEGPSTFLAAQNELSCRSLCSSHHRPSSCPSSNPECVQPPQCSVP